MNPILLSTIKTISTDDRVKFEDLFHKYKNYMFSITLHYLKNTTDAEDAVQEACIKLAKNIDKVDQIDSKRTRGFISIIVRNTCLDILAKSRYEDDIEESIVKDPHTFTEDIENKDQLDRYISSLNDRYKHVLMLTYLYDMKDKEISQILDISEANVRKIRSRALDKVRKNISEVEYE